MVHLLKYPQKYNTMKTMFNLISALFLLIPSTCLAQSDQGEIPLVQTGKIISFDLRSKDIVGSVYINEQFIPAKISGYKGVYMVNYNAYEDEMEIEKDEKLFLLPKKNDYTITFSDGSKTYKIYNYKDKDSSRNSFFMIKFTSPKAELLIKEIIILKKEVSGDRGITSYQPPTLFRTKDAYYISFNNIDAIELPRRKKDFSQLFPSNSSEIEMYVKKNKLSFSKEKDLIQILTYYNNLF